MRKDYIVYASVIFLIIMALVYSATAFMHINNGESITGDITSQKIENSGNANFRPISSGTTGPGDVLVELTPYGASDGNLEVKIAANTHSVDLSQFDLKKIITLEYSNNALKPIEVPRLSGHHSSGILVFDIGEDISSFIIKINGIPKVEERVFNW